MELFRQLVSGGQNLQLTSHKFFGGLVFSTLLSFFLSFYSSSIDHSSSQDNKQLMLSNSMLTCDNVTSGGEIGNAQTYCAGFDPELISNIASPSGGSGDIQYLWLKTTDCTLPVNQWESISGAVIATYDP